VKVIIHAPTESSISRARLVAEELLNSPAEGTIRILAVGPAVTAALDFPESKTDRLLLLCAKTLEKLGAQAPLGAETCLDANYTLTRLQKKGWLYIRA
jgi:intracellular sulfur oxidation DsrE/DsrF family protein